MSHWNAVLSTRATRLLLGYLVIFCSVNILLPICSYNSSLTQIFILFVCLICSQAYLYVVLFILTVHVGSGQAVFNSGWSGFLSATMCPTSQNGLGKWRRHCCEYIHWRALCLSFSRLIFCAWQSNQYSNYLTPEIAVSAPLVIQNKTFISSQVQLSTRLFYPTSHGRSCSRSRSRSRSYKRYCCKILIPNRAFLVRLGSI